MCPHEPIMKDTSEVLQDGDVPDVVVERVHGIVTAGREKTTFLKKGHGRCPEVSLPGGRLLL